MRFTLLPPSGQVTTRHAEVCDKPNVNFPWKEASTSPPKEQKPNSKASTPLLSRLRSSPLQVEKIRQVKAKSLYLQVEKLHQSLTKLDSTIAAVSQVLDEGRHLDVLLARERMLTQIHELKALRGFLQPQEDDRFMFTPPDQVGFMFNSVTMKIFFKNRLLCLFHYNL